MARVAATNADLRKGMVEAFAANERMNQMILEALDPKTWRAKPPGRNARTIAAIFTHVHNVRRKWVRLTAPHLKLPKELNHRSCTLKQAKAGLAESGQACGKMLGEAVVHDLRNDIYAHLLRLPMSFFERTQVGRLIGRVTSDVDVVRLGVQDVGRRVIVVGVVDVADIHEVGVDPRDRDVPRPDGAQRASVGGGQRDHPGGGVSRRAA